jgi:DinB family protein
LNASERAELIARYRDGYRVVMEAFDGISEDELDRAADGEWTPREIAHHLADAEMIGAERIRRLLSEPDAQIQGYDEKAFAHLAMRRPIEPSLTAIQGARESTVQILERMTDEDWKRAGTHSERGPYTVEDWLTVFASHAHDHAAQVRRARGTA